MITPGFIPLILGDLRLFVNVDNISSFAARDEKTEIRFRDPVLGVNVGPVTVDFPVEHIANLIAWAAKEKRWS